MKKLLPFILIAATLLIGGCYREKAENKVRKDHPTWDVRYIPKLDHVFISKDEEGNVWYSRHDGYGEEPTSSEYILFPAKK